MGNFAKDHDEQWEMLLMTLEEVKHGICLFQAQNQTKWVSLIKERLGEKNVIAHNVAEDDAKKGMITSKDFRRWAAETDAHVVIVYNIQLLGMRFGDEETVGKLNFMRDQILAIGKLFVFGVSPYFHLLLSRNARDLYSCIMYHFVLEDVEEGRVDFSETHDFDLGRLSSGDDVLEVARYKELKGRILENGDKSSKSDVSMYLACMESWNAIRAYIPYQEKSFIEKIVKETDGQFAQKKIEIADLEDIWILAETWLEIEEWGKSVFWYEKALCLVREQLGEEHEMYADALVEYMEYYREISDYRKCEECCDKALAIYRRKNMEYSEYGINALYKRAIIYRIKSQFDKALDVYQELLKYQITKFGEQYYNNAPVYNNIGTVYKEQGDITGALQQFEKALELLEKTGKDKEGIARICYNICSIYLESGDGITAWKYIKKTKKIIEDIYGEDSSNHIRIYNSMAEVWALRNRQDKEREYLEKAIEIIKKTHMEDSEMAASVYYNMGHLACRRREAVVAIAYCNRAIDIQRKIYAKETKIIAHAYEAIGYSYLQMHKKNEAKYNFEKTRDIYISLYGAQNEYVRRVEKYLAD